MSRQESIEADIVWCESAGWDDQAESFANQMRGLAKEIDLLTAERDRLAAENTEMQKRLDELGAELSDYKDVLYHNNASADLSDALAQDTQERLWRCIRTAIRLKNKYHSELRAANATLDRLREVVPKCIKTYDGRHALLAVESVYHILYPTEPTP